MQAVVAGVFLPAAQQAALAVQAVAAMAK